MDLKTALAKAVLIAQSNSAEIVLGGALAGVPITAVLFGRARLRADDILMQMEEDNYQNGIDDPLPTSEKAKATWKCYILPVATCGLTMFLMIWSHKIQGRKLIALASAYSLTDSAFREYREKVAETVSKKKLEEINHAIDKDKVKDCTVLDSDILATNLGDVLCVDSWTGRKFFANAEVIRQAVAATNAEMVGDVYVPSSFLYSEQLNMPICESDQELGWNVLVDKKIDVWFTSVLDKENIPALVMHLEPHPRPMYDDL